MLQDVFIPMSYQSNFNIVVPADAWQKLWKGIWKVLSTFVSEIPDKFLFLLMELMQLITVYHDPKCLEVIPCHLTWIQLSKDNKINDISQKWTKTSTKFNEWTFHSQSTFLNIRVLHADFSNIEQLVQYWITAVQPSANRSIAKVCETGFYHL